jgi:squalene-associated FAD-dependent desaturase
MSLETRKRIAIIGGGLAGMAAAEFLLADSNFKKHVSVEIFEAKRRTGGRAGSFEVAGNQVDYCQHVAMGCCHELLALMRRSSLIQYWTRYSSLWFHHPDFRTSVFRPAKWLPAPLHLVTALVSIRYLTSVQKFRLATAILRLMRTKPETIADVTAGQWLQEQKQDATTIGRFWEIILISALGESIEVVSMAMARKVIIDGFVASSQASDVWVPNRTLADLFGCRLPEYLNQNGATIRHSTAVRKIIRRDGNDAGEHRFQIQCQDGVEHRADACILAVPWHRLTALLCPDLAALLEDSNRWAEFPSSPITGVHLWFDRPITDQAHAVMVDTTAQWLFQSPTIDSPPGYCQVVISASHEAKKLSQADLMQKVISELKVAFPNARSAQLLESRIVTDPKSVFSVTPEVQSLRPATKTSVPGLFLAGDWVQTGWPSTMEGAVISGRLAAQEVRAWLPLP